MEPQPADGLTASRFSIGRQLPDCYLTPRGWRTVIARMVYRMRTCLLSILVVLCSACFLFAQASDSTRLAADTRQKTGSGVTFTAPAGWTVRADGAATISVLAPEADTQVVVLDEKAADATTAVAQAWGTYKPGFARPVRRWWIYPT